MRYTILLAIALAACGSDATPATQPDGDTVLEPETTFPEVSETEALPETTIVDAEITQGEFGAPCEANQDCFSGWCVESDSGLICTRNCLDECPVGYDCRSVAAGADVAFICVPEFAKLCTACTQDIDCGRGACLTQEGSGSCAPRCESDSDCAEGYACRSDQSGRVAGLFCQPASGSCACADFTQHGQERACSVATNTGRCSGVEICSVAGWGTCSAATPSDEDCNGRDDDCDGTVDEDLRLGDVCTNDVGGVGSCPGTRVCRGTLGWACDGPTPTPEICDGLDSDCDGKTDEDFKNADGAFALDTACGRCGNDCTTRFANGVGRCAGTGGAFACEVARCDEGFVLFGGQCVPPIDTTCQPCTDDVDCLGGSCVPFGDGNVCAMPCGAGCGAGLTCTTFAVGQRCAPTSGSCACTPALTGNQRTCANENGSGRCLGVETCDGVAWSACSAATPEAELCNGGDDDCDGGIDEDARWDEVGLVCAVGQGICRNVGVYECDAGDPAGPAVCSASAGIGHAESCDGRDEDCDGQTDEDLARPPCALTSGVCASSAKVCGGTSGFLDCSPASYGASYEVGELSCDGKDNDCDGATDEVDADGDDYVAEACGQDDCDDADALVWPGAPEIWDAKDNDCDGVVDEGVIPVGTVIVTEVLREPVGSAYLELTNLGASVVDLRSWQVAGVTIAESVRVAPSDVAVICRAAASYCDYVVDFTLGPTVSVSLAGTEIDFVQVTTLPSAAGRAASLDPSQYSATANDVAGNWCLAPTSDVIAAGNGSPGRPNTSCSGAPAVTGVVPGSGIEHGGDELVISGSGFIAATGVSVGGVGCVGWVIVDDNTLRCRAPAHAPGPVAVAVTKGGAVGTLANGYTYTGEDVTVITWADVQWPATVRVAAGAPSELIFGQVRAQGVTEPGGPPPGITGQVGYGPTGTDPRTTPGWVWSDATWNLQFFDNDEFKGTLTVARPGTYSYAYRFSDDGGVSYMYGDFDPGTADGFSTTNLGTIVVE